MATKCRLTVADSQPLLSFLLNVLELKRPAAKNLLKFGAVNVNGAPVRQFDHPLTTGDEVIVGTLQAAAAAGQLERAQIQVVYEDDALLVVDKPSGLLTVANDREQADTLYVRLNAFLRGRNSAGRERALVTHRLDQETSGLVLFAKSPSVKRALQEAWPTVEKIYYAVVEGGPNREQGTLTAYLSEDPKSLKVFISSEPLADSRLATTHYRLIKTRGALSLVEVRLETGRKHQIRVQLAGLGCPVVGDRRYGTRSNACDRLALHATSLALAHPLTGERLTFTSPLPKPLQKLVP